MAQATHKLDQIHIGKKGAALGFKIWNAYGRIESPVAGYIQQGERSLGEMKPG